MDLSLFAIPTITAAYLAQAQSAEIGAESRVFISDQQTLIVGTITQGAGNIGVFAVDRSYTAPGANNGYSMQVRCMNNTASAAAIVIELGITNDAGTASTATATLGEPQDDDAVDDVFNLPAGVAGDLVAATSGAAPNVVQHGTATITGVTSITGGVPGNVYQVIALPPLDTFVEMFGVTKKDYVPNTKKSLAIPNRYDAAYWIKAARGEVPKLDLTAAHTSFDSGLSRIDGQFVTVMIESHKDDTVLSERLVLCNWFANVTTNRGDGNAVVEDVATGMYQLRTVFC